MEKESKPLISVVVPIYNVEEYLQECVDSILNQTFQNFELILVDDGSPDGSGRICDKYAARDSRVRVIHKENGGSSSARNVGLRNAGGEYILFLDSDDYLNSNIAFEKLAAVCQDRTYDFVLFKSVKGYVAENRFVDRYGDYDLTVFEKENSLFAFQYMLSQHKQLACAWNKIVKRDLLLKHRIFFEEGVIAEDVEWNARLFYASERIAAVNEVFHVYRQARADSITATHSEKHIWDIYHVVNRLIAFADQSDCGWKKSVLSFAAFEYAVLLVNISAFSDFERFGKVRDAEWVLRYAMDKKSKLVCISQYLLGYKNTLRLLKRIRS